MNVVSMHHLLVIFLFEKKENQKENLRLSVSQHFVYHLFGLTPVHSVSKSKLHMHALKTVSTHSNSVFFFLNLVDFLFGIFANVPGKLYL